MTIDKFTKRWANSGTVLEPSGTKQDTGWVDNTQVPYEWLNWLQDRVEEKIDRLVEERLDSYYHGATDPQKMIETGLWSDSWVLADDTPNVISGGATKGYMDLITYFDADNDPYIIVHDVTNTKVEIWNPRTLALESTSSDLSANLPSGSSEVWFLQSMCTDGETLYATFQDENASPKTHRIQAWTLSTWAVKSGWAATGTALTGTGSGRDSGKKFTNVIVADSTKLAVGASYVAASAASSAVIQIVNMADGTIAASGAGDILTTNTPKLLQGSPICSDGTNVFMVVKEASAFDKAYLCSATIANPQVGSGGTGYPLDVDGDFTAGTQTESYLVNCGPDLNVVVKTSDTTNQTSDKLIRTFNSSTADLQAIQRGRDSQATPLTSTGWLGCRSVRGIHFDGINVWILGSIVNLTASGKMMTAIKIDAGKLMIKSSRNTATETQLPNIARGPYYIPPNTVETTSGYNGFLQLTFDGRDIWSIVEPDNSQTNSGKIFRIPMALIRS
jgi:hypothetical protein